MAKTKKATTKRAARPVTRKPEQNVIDDVILLMTSGLRDSQLRATAIAVIKQPESLIDAAIVEARKRLTLAAEYNRNEELALSIEQWRKLFTLAIQQNSLPDASSARNRLDSLLGLKQPPPIEPTSQPGENPEGAAIRKHLLPFNLCGADEPLTEHVRMAALKLCEGQ